mgnify:CR=1 FL=1
MCIKDSFEPCYLTVFFVCLRVSSCNIHALCGLTLIYSVVSIKCSCKPTNKKTWAKAVHTNEMKSAHYWKLIFQMTGYWILIAPKHNRANSISEQELLFMVSKSFKFCSQEISHDEIKKFLSITVWLYLRAFNLVLEHWPAAEHVLPSVFNAISWN